MKKIPTYNTSKLVAFKNLIAKSTYPFRNACCVLLLLFSGSAMGQLSSGGWPLEIEGLKSAAVQDHTYVLPKINVDQFLRNKQRSVLEKSVTYACPVELALNPANSGQWYQSGGMKIWQLSIKSEAALSIGLVFTKYHLPPGARLFVSNAEKELVYGAFTSANNKAFRKLAIYPFPGDEVWIQYEEPLDAAFEADLELGTVYHDFLGVVSMKNRWKQRASGACNVDINCGNNSGLENEQRAVCRIFAGGELGTGTLLNNTVQDGQPLLLSAHHVYHKTEPNTSVKGIAEISLFDFNYERPFCVPIDGSDIQSVSGSTLLSSFDSLDFVLVELSEMPPPSYRPYFAGWDASGLIPANSYTIHHPNGDVKKITHDEGTCDSLSFSGGFIRFGHWEVLNWESGTTESGSSGSGLFSQEKRLFGTLSGGAASCKVNGYDAFARFDKMWNYRKENNQQLATWLDAGGTGTKVMDGFDPYVEENLQCTLVSNYMTEDALENTRELQALSQATEFADRFDQLEGASLAGISIGIQSYKIQSQSPEMSIRIYSGDESPLNLEKVYRYSMKGLTAGAMNYFTFDDPVSVSNTFYVTVSSNDPLDSLVLYCSSERGLVGSSSMFLRNGSGWHWASDFLPGNQGASLLMQVNVCASSFKQDVDSLDDVSSLIKIYPNPAHHYLVVEFMQKDQSNELRLSDVLGKIIYAEKFTGRAYAEIDITNYQPGIYLLSINSQGKQETIRVQVL